MKNIITKSFYGIILLLVAINVYVFNHAGEGRISIHFSDKGDDLYLVARYPAAKTIDVIELLHDDFQLTKHIGLTTEFKDYHTPDNLIHFYLRSKPGRLKIVLNKSTNSTAGIKQINSFNERLKGLLTR